MTVLTQLILDKALQLPQGERVEMARELLLSVGSPTAETAAAAEDGVTFSEKWRGKFEPAERDDERYRALAQKYL